MALMGAIELKKTSRAAPSRAIEGCGYHYMQLSSGAQN
jgi:hypothetical protein